MKHYLILAVLIGLTACNNQQDGLSSQSQNTEPQPGQILLQDLRTASSCSPLDSSTTYAFNLDTAKSSIENEFILQNTGDYDVKNIKLTTNNPNFYFSPSEIPILPPSKKSLIMQVIKLNVIHGVRLNGIGADSLLPMGNIVATAQITASTSNSHHDSIGISQSAQLKIFAQVMDMNIFVGQGHIPLGPPHTLGPGLLTAVPDYEIYCGDAIRFLNIGNVDITIKDALNGNVITIVKVDSSYRMVKQNSDLYIELDGKGVISNSIKFPKTSDRAIIEFWNRSGNCILY